MIGPRSKDHTTASGGEQDTVPETIADGEIDSDIDLRDEPGELDEELAALGDEAGEPEVEEAVTLLERSVAAGFGHWKWIENDSDFEPLHSNARYQALLAHKDR